MDQAEENNLKQPGAEIGAGEDHSGTERLKALADGLFGVVMTLLVLDLKLPKPVPDSNLIDTLTTGFLPNFIIYAITFLTAGIYWYNHVHIMRRLKHIDRSLIWLNLAFFLFITVLPFTANLFNVMREAPGGIGSNTVIIYSANNVIIGVLLIVIWLYASGGYRLITKEVQPYEIPLVTWEAAVMPVTALTSIITTLISGPDLGIAAYYVVPATMSTAVGIAQGRARRKHEGVLVFHLRSASYNLAEGAVVGSR